VADSSDGAGIDSLMKHIQNTLKDWNYGNDIDVNFNNITRFLI
jgi:hypothetical protein